MIERALDAGFVKLRQNLIVTGPPGTGKSLLVTIVACKAIWAGFSVKYKTGYDIAIELSTAPRKFLTRSNVPNFFDFKIVLTTTRTFV